MPLDAVIMAASSGMHDRPAARLPLSAKCQPAALFFLYLSYLVA
jgi:hypothetical protein